MAQGGPLISNPMEMDETYYFGFQQQKEVSECTMSNERCHLSAGIVNCYAPPNLSTETDTHHFSFFLLTTTLRNKIINNNRVSPRRGEITVFFHETQAPTPERPVRIL